MKITEKIIVEAFTITLEVQPGDHEAVASMQARYSAALEMLFDVDHVAAGLQHRPATHRANVFDFEDEVRLIISRDMSARGETLHLSFSSRFIKQKNDCLRELSTRFQLLSGIKGAFKVTGIQTPRGVWHMILPWPLQPFDPMGLTPPPGTEVIIADLVKPNSPPPGYMGASS